MRRLVVFAALVGVVIAAPASQAYLKIGFIGSDGRIQGLKWDRMPIRYLVTNRDVPGVTATQLQDAVDRAFDEWASAPAVSISTQFVGFTSIEPGPDDGVSVIGFRSRPDLERVLGATSFEFDNITGEFLASDIFLNSEFTWSVAASGDSSRFDVESISVHEVGHLLGLGHSALGETRSEDGGRTVLGKRAVMFPIAYPRGNIEDRSLEADDRAGIADAYATSSSGQQFGSIRGRVTLNGSGIFGAHVTAFNQKTGDLVGGFSLGERGEFVISGLGPGLYVVRVEPLDDADIDSFFDEDTVVNINFKPTYHASLVAVPSGGSGEAIEIRVQAK